jgi:hypothetical protein
MESNLQIPDQPEGVILYAESVEDSRMTGMSERRLSLHWMRKPSPAVVVDGLINV